MTRLPGFVPALAALACAALGGCGYHVAGRADLMPKTIKTIAIPAFGNTTTRYQLARLLPTDLTREFLSRTRYAIVADPAQADAVLTGALTNFAAFAAVADPVSGRATGVQVIVTMQLTLTERSTGKVLFQRAGYEIRERYELSVDPQAYFDESGTAIQRVSKDAARSIVSGILENF
jgi:outer membrane lipopolysaccharide assembly protein LptE/RlpB